MSLKSQIQKLAHIAVEDDMEQKVREVATYNPDELKNVDTKKLFEGYELKKLGEGLNSRVFRIVGTNWVIKEAKWDMKVDIMGETKIPIPKTILNIFLRLFGKRGILPRPYRTKVEYEDYLEFAQYFGHFSDDTTYFHPSRHIMLQSQKNIRRSLSFFVPEIENKYAIKIKEKITDILKDDRIIYHNFLPKEYLIYGPSFSKENFGRSTEIIFQEFIKGETLFKADIFKQSIRIKKQFILMLYLILLMHLQTDLLPDTRPHSYSQILDWVTKTDNVIVHNNELKFIDTRWFWNTKSNFVRRGFVIPELIIQKTKASLLRLLKEV